MVRLLGTEHPSISLSRELKLKMRPLGIAIKEKLPGLSMFPSSRSLHRSIPGARKEAPVPVRQHDQKEEDKLNSPAKQSLSGNATNFPPASGFTEGI
jgi:hypothetical protein